MENLSTKDADNQQRHMLLTLPHGRPGEDVIVAIIHKAIFIHAINFFLCLGVGLGARVTSPSLKIPRKISHLHIIPCINDSVQLILFNFVTMLVFGLHHKKRNIIFTY